MDNLKIKVHDCKDFTCNGKCSKCGACCSNLLPLTKVEIKRLKRLVKRKNLKPHRHNVANAIYDMTCPFLTSDHKCSIYDERPVICKIFLCSKQSMSINELKGMWNAKPTNIREEIFK